jgi:hypothetical protein
MVSLLQKTIVTSLFICIGFVKMKAQVPFPKVELGVTAGTFVYQGDVTPVRAGAYNTIKPPQFGVFITRLLGPSLSLRLNFTAGKLKGDDARYASPYWRKERNFKFSTPVTEITALLQWDVTGQNYSRQAKSLAPYFFVGAGYALFHIRRDWSGINRSLFVGSQVPAGLPADSAHQVPRGLPVVPAGFGLRYAISQDWSLLAETSYRFVFNDYLDGFSKAANPARDDHFFSHSLGVIYTFGRFDPLACPVLQY